MFGFINVSKPSGKTSRLVVDRVGRCAAKAKAGHAGTLDPLASGVLVVAIGGATRLISYVQQMPKRYQGAFLLGRDSPTEDVDGPVVELNDGVVPTREALAAAARQLTGTIQQQPPAFSALKIQGRRAYAVARRGEEGRAGRATGDDPSPGRHALRLSRAAAVDQVQRPAPTIAHWVATWPGRSARWR